MQNNDYNDYKIDSQLKVSTDLTLNELEKSNISSGYNEASNLWEVIVKYNGSLTQIKNELNVDIEILSSNYAIITLSKEKILPLSNYYQIEYIEQPRNLYLNLDLSLINSCVSEVFDSPYNLTGEGSLVAIIDSGINYTHKDFINPDGTSRILFLWDQSQSNSSPPSGFKYGSLYTNEDLNKALLSQNPFSIVPENDFLGHGTHVASIAAGNGSTSNGRYKGVAPKSSLIIVKIGNNSRKSFALTTEIMRAIKFILDKAVELNMPVAINLSFGTNDGSHSGNSLFEEYINSMANIWKCSIVCATGNEGSSSNHYKNVLKTSEIDTIEFTVSSDLKSLYLVLWKNFNDTFNFEVIGPNGISTGIINYTSLYTKFNFGFANLYVNIGQPSPYNIEQEVFFEIISNSNFLNQGIWAIKVYSVNSINGEFDVWLPITEFSSNETKFLQPNLETTLTIPSTASRVISVGAYNSLNNSVADFSGRGYKRNGLIKPDIVAPGVNITAASNSGGYEKLSGTSMAAPFVTGSCAVLMQWGIVQKNDIFLYGQRLKAFLQLGAKKNPNLTYPNNQWGYGSLCLKSTLDKLSIFKNNLFLTTSLDNSNLKNNLNTNLDYSSFSNLPKFSNINLENTLNTKINANVNTNLNNNLISNSNINLNNTLPNTLLSCSNNLNCDETPFYSNNYIGIVTEYNSEIQELLNSHSYIKLAKVLSGGFAVIYIEKEYENELLNGVISTLIFQRSYLLGLMNTSTLNASGILSVQNQPFLNLRGSGVLVGIVDTGIDYTCDTFIYEDGTSKIISIWDQTISGNPPKNSCYGSEFTTSQINEALLAENPFNIVPTKDEDGHGTKLASIACGRKTQDKNFIGAAPDAELIVVKLKQAKSSIKERLFNTSNINAYESIDLMLGIEYIYEKSLELNRPVAICIGMGTNSGGHIGLSILEKYISELASKNGIAMCVCAGNEGSTNHHCLVNLSSSEDEKSIELRIGEGEAAFPIEIWSYPFDRISVSVTSPSGETTGKIPFRNNFSEEILLPLSNTSVIIGYITNSLEGNSQLTLIQFKNPVAGVWKINIFGENILLGSIHSWLPISNFITENTYFLSPNPFYTATTPATSNFILSVGGYNSLDNSLFFNSGRGPTRDNNLVPILLAPSVNVSCIGPFNTVQTLTGTSAGTAIVTGAAALMLEWGIVKGNSFPMNTSNIIGYFASSAKRSQNEIYPSNITGFGVLDLYSVFQNL